MDVTFYGRLADRIGARVSIDTPPGGCSIAQLRQLIADQHSQVADDILRPHVRACVDDCIVPETHQVDAAKGVEFFPPVSGG